MEKQDKIDPESFYSNYYGHETKDLNKLLNYAKQKSRPIVYFIGDSSLDNKHWLLHRINSSTNAINGYENLMKKSYKDVCYFMNDQLSKSKSEYFCINCAVEEASINEKDGGKKLSDQDILVRDNIKNEDVLVVSIGGNDVALKPNFSIITKMLWLTRISNIESIKKGTAWGLEYFVEMFKDKVEKYIKTIIGDKKPKKILVCMIYYPHIKEGGWADFTLGKLNYNKKPYVLQTLIRTMHEQSTKKIKIEGVEVVPIPLFEVLDSSESSRDYIERVEPSIEGGEKMAKEFLRHIIDLNNQKI